MQSHENLNVASESGFRLSRLCTAFFFAQTWEELSTAVIRAAHWTTCTHHIPTGVLIDRAVDVQGPAAAAAASCPCGYVSSCVSSHSAWGQVLHPDIVI